MHNKIMRMVMYSLFSSLTAALSFISVPITPIPINLAMVSVFLSGALLGAKGGAISQFIYVVLRFIGIPIFLGVSGGGVGFIAGPTGGYVVGYILSSGIVGTIIQKYGRSRIVYAIAMLAGVIACYFLGTVWFMLIMKTNLINSLILCVVPFIVGDIIKILVSCAVVDRIYNLSVFPHEIF